MEIRPSLATRSQWDAALGAPALQHCWAYGAVAARFGATIRRYEIGAAGRAQAVCRGIGPLKVGYLPLGIHWSDGGGEGDALPALRRAVAAEHGPMLLIASGPCPGAVAPRLSGPRTMALLDIDAEMAALRAALSKKWRNRLAHAEHSGLSTAIEEGIPGWLVDTERAQQRRRRYGNLPPSWIEAWTRVAPGASFTIVAERAGDAVAAMSFVLHGAAATYLIGWSGDAGRMASAHNLTLWRGVEVLRSRGIRRLDLGQVDAAANPGLARFKTGTGARLVTVPPARAFGPWTRGAPTCRPG